MNVCKSEKLNEIFASREKYLSNRAIENILSISLVIGNLLFIHHVMVCYAN